MTPRRRVAQNDPTQTDALGLGKDVEIAKLIPAVQPADIGFPVVAKYLGYEIKHSRTFNRDQRLYQFQLPSEYNGVKFSLWAHTQLDLKLSSITRTSIVLLQYCGRPEGERTQHQWIVRPFRGTTTQLRELVAQYEQGCRMVMETVQMLEQSMDGNSASMESDDLPF